MPPKLTKAFASTKHLKLARSARVAGAGRSARYIVSAVTEVAPTLSSTERRKTKRMQEAIGNEIAELQARLRSLQGAVFCLPCYSRVDLIF